MPGAEACALQCANRFESAEDSDDAVIFSCVRNRIDVRAGSDSRNLRIGANPTCECVAGSVLAQDESRIRTLFLDPIARLALSGSEDDTGDGGRFGVRESRECLDFGSDVLDRLPVSSSVIQRMPVPIFVDEIFRWHFSDGAKPLRTPRAHPDEVSGGHWIP